MLRNQIFQVVCNFPVHADLVQGPGPVFVHPQHFALIRVGQSLLYFKVSLKSRGQIGEGPANDNAGAAIDVRNFCCEGWVLAGGIRITCILMLHIKKI